MKNLTFFFNFLIIFTCCILYTVGFSKCKLTTNQRYCNDHMRYPTANLSIKIVTLCNPKVELYWFAAKAQAYLLQSVIQLES